MVKKLNLTNKIQKKRAEYNGELATLTVAKLFCRCCGLFGQSCASTLSTM